ncbi:FAD-dependent oxidoreductase [Microbaculum marinum]|uniref:FAD-dependent oxidoreductase n=1 Tax=Microbaculum marinum TaxID=1764581 RepID=A0AAW9REY1_9HYPH
MSRPVVIVGAGPAGLACAGRLSAAGREVVLIDDNAQAGGQYFRQLPPGYEVAPDAGLLRDKARHDRLAGVLSQPGVRHLAGTIAWGAPAPLTIAYAGPHRSGRIEASAVVLANGAQDRPFPFKGWTLPGVISAGGCLNLAKADGLVPTGRLLVAGNGPLVLVAAATMIAAGADVVGVIEARRTRHLAGTALRGIGAAPAILRTAIGYQRRILLSGIRIRTGWMVCEAEGGNSIRRAAIAPVGPDGRPVRERREWLDVDTLVVGYGLMPSAEFARILGCRTESRPDLAGVVPVRSAQLETSVPGVYAVGDGAGIGGVEVALLEGEIAASAILRQVPQPALLSRYRRLDGFRRDLNRAYSPSVPLRAAGEDTIVCRCEELRLGDIAGDANVATGSLDRVKTSSRLGMGRCQGRNCLPAAAAALGLSDDDAVSTYPRSRPPVRPVQLRHLASDANAGPAREPDEANAQQ